MQIQMEGKNCIITGANSGIGYATAEGLASRGATVYMVCRSKERGEAALSKIQSSTGNPNVYLEVCDISSIAQIKSFVSRFTSMDKPVHVLVNNAGVMLHEHVETSEGLEMNFAINVAGTYTLTELIVPLLKKAAPDARVITVSSGGMYTEPLTKDLEYREGNFDGAREYARHKRAQVALTEKWAETHDSEGIGFYSMHPGWAATPGVSQSLPSFNDRMWMLCPSMSSPSHLEIDLQVAPTIYGILYQINDDGQSRKKKTIDQKFCPKDFAFHGEDLKTDAPFSAYWLQLDIVLALPFRMLLLHKKQTIQKKRS